MKLFHSVSIQEIVELTGSKEIIGDRSIRVTGINEIHKVEPGDITFVDHQKYYKKSIYSDASVIIIDRREDCPEGKALILHPEPFEAYSILCRLWKPPTIGIKGICKSAQISKTAVIEEGVTIGANTIIGDHSHIQHNVFIGNDSIIGNNVKIQVGTIIGTDAFYFKNTSKGYQKWYPVGRVVIEDDVDIGAGCTINRGVSGTTRIGEGSKIDSQVHIGHGVVLGKRCLLAAQVGIGGKTVIGDDATIYGQVGIGQSLTIGNDVTILGKSGVTKDLKGGDTYFGYPAAPARDQYRSLATLKSLAKKNR